MTKNDPGCDPVKQIKEAKVFLAPMAGITDVAFRLLARSYGCRYAFTEMIDVNAVYHTNRKTLDRVKIIRRDRPLGVQILGHDEKKTVYTAKHCEDKGFGLLDFNAGCPAKKVVKNGITADRTGMVINSSRGIIYAGSGKNFTDSARMAAKELRDEINSYRLSK